MSNDSDKLYQLSFSLHVNWSISQLVETVLGKAPANNAPKEEKAAYTQRQLAIINFLERVYHELRNLGMSPQDRSINYAATNALNAAGIFAEAIKDQMQLDAIETEPSPICRPGAECWDVKLICPERVGARRYFLL